MPDDLNLTCTNGDLWLATRGDETKSSAFGRIVAVPIKAYSAMNRTALIGAVENALKEIDAARIACCEHHGTKTEDGLRFVFATPDAEAACNAEFADILKAERILPHVAAIKRSDLRPDAFLDYEDEKLCGPLLTD